MAERVARHLSERLGDDAVTAHHGSLSKEKRLDAEVAPEERAAEGAGRDGVARARHRHRPRRSRLPDRLAASDRDLASARRPRRPHRVAARRRAGCSRSRATTSSSAPRCSARSRRGELDAIVTHDAPLDVLAQQIVAETACEEYARTSSFALVRRAWPYRAPRARRLRRGGPDAGRAASRRGAAAGPRWSIATKCNGALRGRRGARLPRHHLGRRDSRGRRLPRRARARGDVRRHAERGLRDREHRPATSFSSATRRGGSCRSAPASCASRDAQGAPPTMPFWLGEAPARSDELSRAVSELRARSIGVCREPMPTPLDAPSTG